MGRDNRSAAGAAGISLAGERLDGSQAFAADTAPVGEGGFAALGGITGKQSVLPLAAKFRRLILAFHRVISFN